MRRGRVIVLISSLLALALCGTVVWLASGVFGAPTAHKSATSTPITAAPSSSATPSPTAEGLAPGNHPVTIEVQGHERTLTLHVPPAAATHHPLPLVLAFHGAYETASDSEKETDLTSTADSRGFLVAYMQGYQDTWNDLNGHTAAQTAGIDDVAYTTAALKAVEQQTSVDSAHVIAAGFSNGALFTDLLGCASAAPFTTLIIAEGQFSSTVSASCHPSKPISVIQINGTADPTIPYGGGSVTLSGSTVDILSARDAIATWAHLDGCSGDPQQTSQGSTVHVETYQTCRNGVTVQLRTVDGGVHSWPSDIGALVASALG
ncbi:PHB depolymerase family esterase [Humibacter soli]